MFKRKKNNRKEVVKMKKALFLGIMAFALLVLLSPVPAPAQQEIEIRIGCIYPLTGPVGQAGINNKNAIELAEEIVNTTKYKHLNVPLAGAGGLPNLKGAKVKVIFADHQGKPDLGLSEAERMITQEKIVALTGCYHSSVTETASMVAERMKFPFYNFESSSAKLTERGLKWFFRSSPHDGTFSEAMFAFVKEYGQKKNIKFKTIAVMYEDTLYGKDSARVEKELAAAAGYKVVADIPFRRSATSLTSEIQKLKMANPDIFFPTAYISDAILMTKTAKELHYDPPMVMAQDSGHTEPSYVEAMGKDIDGICSREEFSMDLVKHKPMIAELNQMYKERFGRDFSGPAARAFVGFLALCDAINRAGSTDPEAIRKAIRETNIPGDKLLTPWRGIKFDEKGQNVLVDAIVIQYQDGGKRYTIFPFNLATKEIIFPIPKWSERK
jgi:branched-chain amino acid transport system substrate-binding protein